MKGWVTGGICEQPVGAAANESLVVFGIHLVSFGVTS